MAVVAPSSEKFSSALKHKAIKMYMENGNLSLTARLLEVPFNTMQHWRYRTTWWPELEKRFQEEADRKLSAKMDKLIGKAVEKVEDRIENGDSILDSRTGDVIQVPLKVKDLTTTIKVLSDRTDVLIGRATKDGIAKEMMADKLAKLAKEFANFNRLANEKVIEGEVIEHSTQAPAEDTDVVEDDILDIQEEENAVHD
jgi:transposase-like protein